MFGFSGMLVGGGVGFLFDRLGDKRGWYGPGESANRNY